MSRRRHFGTVRQRASGRWQALYEHEGRPISAGTFATKADALAALSTAEADMRRGSWIDPRSGNVSVEQYATEWLNHRSDLAATTQALYRHVLGRHILPQLGRTTLAGLAPSKVRGWHAELAGEHPATAAKAYRLLSTILRTAVTDGLISANPCRVKGAGVERSVERPIATVGEVEALTAAMPDHLRVVVPLAVWCQLRRGEILGLRRKDVDTTTATIRIEQSRTFRMDGKAVVKSPKTKAGARVVAVPRPVMEVVVRHLAAHTGPDPSDALVTGRDGRDLTRDALQGVWERAREAVGRRDLRLHDLRHTGLTLAAATGATTVELMHRAGHASPGAAMRYQHAIRDRDRSLADALEMLVSSAERIVTGEHSASEHQ